MIPTRDDDTPLKKKNDEQNLVTTELIQVLHSKQTKIDELEQQLKDVEQQASQWKVNSSINFFNFISPLIEGKT
jgi:predicted nuclease with TOPRIM domain